MSENVCFWLKIEDQSQIESLTANGSWGILTNLGIVVDGKELSGENSGYIAGEFCSLLLGLLESVEPILNDERQVIRTSDNPANLVIEPAEDGRTRILIAYTKENAYNPSQRWNIEPTATAPRGAIVEAILETSEEELASLLELNPAIRSSPRVARCRQALTNAREVYEASLRE